MALEYFNSKSGVPVTQRDLMAFSPVDMQIYMAGEPLRSVLQISYQIHREVASLYGFGDANPVGFNRGKRGIAGSLICNTFTDHPLLRGSWAKSAGLVNNAKDATLGNAFTKTSGGKDLFRATLDDYAFTNGTFNINTNPQFSGGTFSLGDPTIANELTQSYDWVKQRKFNYVDQLPPMDIVITCVNEMGNAAFMSLNSVIMINEAGMMSMESLTSETHFTFLARSITPLRAYMATTVSGQGNDNSGLSRIANSSVSGI